MFIAALRQSGQCWRIDSSARLQSRLRIAKSKLPMQGPHHVTFEHHYFVEMRGSFFPKLRLPYKSSNARRVVSYAGPTHMWLQRAAGLRKETRHVQRCIQRYQFRQLSIPQSLQKKAGPSVQDDPLVEQNGVAKLPARKTSLRRVGLEAERSRVVVQHKGGMRVVDPEAQTKVIHISCRVYHSLLTYVPRK